MTKATLKAHEQFLSLQLPEHGVKTFLTEGEIRNTVVFEVLVGQTVSCVLKWVHTLSL
jgi:hypothetical protein